MYCNAVGVVTGRDRFAIDFDRTPLLDRISTFCDPRYSDDQVRALFDIRDAGGYVLSKRRPIVKGTDPEQYIRRVLYRPFDQRWIAYSRGFLTADQFSVMRHMLAGHNLGLSTTRSIDIERGWEHVFVSRDLIQHHTVSIKEVNYFFPFWIRDDVFEVHEGDEVANLAEGFLAALPHGPRSPASPECALHFIYAVLHSPDYRERYRAFLKGDFPRIPLPGSREVFDALVPLGERLVALHLLEAEDLEPAATLEGDGDNTVVKITYDEGAQAVSINKTQAFAPVPPETYAFTIGGYQVLNKWLKDRKGRTLTDEDVRHYGLVVAALTETRALMARIDEVIEEHGGWPGAFDTTPRDIPEPAPKAAKAKPARKRKSNTAQTSLLADDET